MNPLPTEGHGALHPATRFQNDEVNAPPAPEARLGFWSTKGNTFAVGTLVVLLGPTRCRILEYVIRLLPAFLAEKAGGSRPWTRVWPHRIEPCSPNVRPCRTDSEGSSLALPMGVFEGYTPRRAVRFTRHPDSRRYPCPTDESRRWQAETSRRPRRSFPYRFPWRSGHQLR